MQRRLVLCLLDSGERWPQPWRRQSFVGCSHDPRRRLHRHPGPRLATVPHALPLLYTQGGPRRGYHSRGRLHGGDTGRQAHVAHQE